MKRESNRKIKDYSRYDYSDYEYYGLLPKNGKLRVDVKRFLMYTHLPKKIKDELNKARKTVYFVPAKDEYGDYNINYFKSVLSAVRKEWKEEVMPAMKQVLTPKQAGDREYSGHWVQTGIMEPDEVSMHAGMMQMRRAQEYGKIMASFYAQFIHQFASRVEAITVTVLKNNNHEVDHFSRQRLKDIYNGATKKQLEDLNTYMYYDQFYKVWNFLKHNSISAYNKLKDNYPEFLYKPDRNKYTNGHLAYAYLILNDETIDNFIINLGLFFNEFCVSLFNEKVEESEWNYDQYFYREARDEIESIDNPLGLPPWI